MATREPGNKKVFGTPSPNSTPSREDSIIARTKTQAFPSEDSQISLENFEHKGDKPAGTQNSVADMQNLTGKDLNESYRAGLSKSAQYTDKVSDR
jgi:hypothetical protein